MQRGHRLVLTFHQYALGELEAEPGRVEPGRLERLTYGGGEGTLSDLTARDVDGDPNRGKASVLPRPVLSTCSPDPPFAQGNDQPILLRNRDEFRREQQAESGMLPSDQRLRARDRTASCMDDRLIVQQQ